MAISPFTTILGLGAKSAFPWWSLASLGLPLLGGLFGRGDEQRKLQARIAQIMSEGSISARANDIMKHFYQSPAYSQVQGLAMTAGRQAEGEAARVGAGTGVTSGIDVLRRAGAAGVGSGTLANIVGARSNLAHGEATQANTALAQMLAGMGPSPNYSNELFGSSLNFLGPILSQYFAKRYGWNQNRQGGGFA